MKTFTTYAKLLLTLIIWSFSYVWTKQCLEVLSPTSLVFFRLLISSFFLILIAKSLKKFKKLDKEYLRIMVGMALLEPFGYFLSETYGLKLVTPTIAAVIIATIPVFTPFAAAIFLKQKMKIVNFIGILISFAGLLLILIGKNSSFEYSILGVSFIFIAVFIAIFYSVICSRFLEKYNAYTVVSYQNSFGALYFFPIFLLIDIKELHFEVFDLNLVGLILLLSFFASTIAFLFYIDSIRDLGIVKVNAMINTMPIFTAFYSYLILNEEISTRKIIGILIVILGVILSQTDLKNRRFKSFLNKIYQ